MRITHSWTDETATIRVSGLQKPLRVLHVTDSHVSLVDPDDAAHLEKATPHREKFSKRRQDAQGNNVFTEVSFAEAAQRAKAEKVDLLALTGDIVHFPSQANVHWIQSALSTAQVTSLYTSGNHDWHFPGEVGRDELRDKFWPALQPLYETNGKHANKPACGAREIGGVLFLAVDDSTYQITHDQLAFAKRELARGLPTVLLIHIPISIATLRDKTIERWKAPILIGDPDWGMPSRTEWDTPADRPETLEFVRLCSTATNLAAVLCGHIHFPHSDALSPQAVQYVTRPGYEGGMRMIELLPL
ncbi:MAG TPA: metallophosphoesterase [Planctomycetota bacterium]|nr:metallophosphoesterase [Planctomycetota bacterium]